MKVVVYARKPSASSSPIISRSGRMCWNLILTLPRLKSSPIPISDLPGWLGYLKVDGPIDAGPLQMFKKSKTAAPAALEARRDERRQDPLWIQPCSSKVSSTPREAGTRARDGQSYGPLSGDSAEVGVHSGN